LSIGRKWVVVVAIEVVDVGMKEGLIDLSYVILALGGIVRTDYVL
jgi:hypothetical protein